MEYADAAADADARFPGMDGLPPGGPLLEPLPDPDVPQEIQILMNTPISAWTDDNWLQAGWVRITDPAVARSTGVALGSYVPSTPARQLGEGEPNHLEAEWLQLGWTRLREDPLDPMSPVVVEIDGTEVWVPPGPLEWADVRRYARFAPPGGVPPSFGAPQRRQPAAPAAAPPYQQPYQQQHQAYNAQTYAAPQSPPMPPGGNGWGSPMSQSPAYGGMPFIPPGSPMGWSAGTPPPPAMGGQTEELLAARRQLEEVAAKEKAAQTTKIEELTKQLHSLMGQLTIQQQTIDSLRAPGERAGMQPAGGGSPEAATPTAAYGVGINSRVPDADSCRRQLFGAPAGVAQPLTRELKELFLKYHVAETIQTTIASHGCTDCQTFFYVGHDYKEARTALAQLAGIELNGPGVVQVAQLMSVWQSLSERYSERKDVPDEAAAQAVIEEAFNILTTLGIKLDPYLQPDAVSLNIVQKNYRSKRYEAVDVNRFKSNSMDPGDILSKQNRKKLTDHRMVQVAGAPPGEWTPIETVENLDLKAYRRAMDLYLWAELTVGNMCHPKQPGQHPHFTMADKVCYETHLARFGFDPSVKWRMELPHLKSAEIYVRTHIMQLVKEGDCWRDALQKLAVMIEMKFQLKSEVASVDLTQAQKDIASLKGVVKQLEQKNQSMQQKLARMPKGKGKGKGKDGAGKGGGYGRWQDHKDFPKGGTDKHGYCPDFLQTHPQSGDPFCRKYNRGVPHDAEECKKKKYLHQCSWKNCTNRKNCKTPGIKHKP